MLALSFSALARYLSRRRRNGAKISPLSSTATSSVTTLRSCIVCLPAIGTSVVDVAVHLVASKDADVYFAAGLLHTVLAAARGTTTAQHLPGSKLHGLGAQLVDAFLWHASIRQPGQLCALAHKVIFLGKQPLEEYQRRAAHFLVALVHVRLAAALLLGEGVQPVPVGSQLDVVVSVLRQWHQRTQFFVAWLPAWVVDKRCQRHACVAGFRVVRGHAHAAL